MALIKCPECGADISSQALSCPHCGFPIKDTDVLDENISIGYQQEQGAIKARDENYQKNYELYNQRLREKRTTQRIVFFLLLACGAVLEYWLYPNHFLAWILFCAFLVYVFIGGLISGVIDVLITSKPMDFSSFSIARSLWGLSVGFFGMGVIRILLFFL